MRKKRKRHGEFESQYEEYNQMEKNQGRSKRSIYREHQIEGHVRDRHIGRDRGPQEWGILIFMIKVDRSSSLRRGRDAVAIHPRDFKAGSPEYVQDAVAIKVQIVKRLNDPPRHTNILTKG